MQIEVNIPALDRLCDILEKSGGLPSINATTTGAPAETPAAAADPKPAGKGKGAAAGKKEETPAKEEKPTVTQEQVTAVATKFIELNGPSKLRALLDNCGIKGEKISTCDPKFYEPIQDALQAAIDSADDGGL